MKKGKNAGYLSYIVFKGLLPHFRENLGLCGKCLVCKMLNNNFNYTNSQLSKE